MGKTKTFLLSILILCFKTEAQTSVLHLADSLYTYGKYSQAIKHYKSHEDQNEVFGKIAKAYMAIGNYGAALETYKEGIVNAPEDELAKYEYGKLLFKTKKYEASAQVLNELVYQDYKNPNYHYELGLVLEQLRDSTAQNRFHSAYQLDNTHQKAIYRIAKYYIRKGKNTLADDYIDKGLSVYENNKDLISLKAQNFYVRKQYVNAIVWFEKLVALNESTQFVHEKLSFAYARTLELEKAIEHQLLALKFQPKNTTNLYILGTLYNHVEDFPKAEEYISKALNLLDEPLHVEYMALGMALNRQKKHKEALEAYKKAVRESPSNDQANFFLVLTKDHYYKDIDTKIKLYESYKKNFSKSMYIPMVEHRISKLKEEKFMETD